MTLSMPSSMVSTMSAWCSASRAAHEMASDGVASADGSRWCGRPEASVLSGLGSQACTQRATTWVMPMKHRHHQVEAQMEHHHQRGRVRAQAGAHGAATGRPAALQSGCPDLEHQVAHRHLACSTIGLHAWSAPPAGRCPGWRPAPGPAPRPAGSRPRLASVAVSSTMARLEYDTTASTAPMVISSSRSLVSVPSRALTAGAWSAPRWRR
jgi:hypothetical protein